MSWYEYLMSRTVDELGEFLAAYDEIALFYCNGTHCTHFKDNVECSAFNKWCNNGKKADEYPCRAACVAWLNSERKEQ